MTYEPLTPEQSQLVEDHLVNATKAARFFSRLWSRRFHFEDLLSTAQFGLVQAARTYNPAKGTKFSSHAFNTMRGYLLQFKASRMREAGWQRYLTADEVAQGRTGWVRRATFVDLPAHRSSGDERPRKVRPEGTQSIDEVTVDPWTNIEHAIETEQRRALALTGCIPRDRLIFERLLAGDRMEAAARAGGMNADHVRLRLVPDLVKRARRLAEQKHLRTTSPPGRLDGTA